MGQQRTNLPLRFRVGKWFVHIAEESDVETLPVDADLFVPERVKNIAQPSFYFEYLRIPPLLVSLHQVESRKGKTQFPRVTVLFNGSEGALAACAKWRLAVLNQNDRIASSQPPLKRRRVLPIQLVATRK